MKRTAVALTILAALGTVYVSAQTAPPSLLPLVNGYSQGKGILYHLDITGLLKKTPGANDSEFLTITFRSATDGLAVIRRAGKNTKYASTVLTVKKNTWVEIPSGIGNRITLLYYTPGAPSLMELRRGDLKVPVIPTAAKSGGDHLFKEFRLALLTDDVTDFPGDHEFQYRRAVLLKRFNPAAKLDHDFFNSPRDRTGDLGNLFELLSGAKSIEGTLQFSTMKTIDPKGQWGIPKIPLSALPAPKLEFHDFSDLPVEKKFDIPGSAGFAPYDAAYLRFKTPARALEFLSLMELLSSQVPQLDVLSGPGNGGVNKVLGQMGLSLKQMKDPLLESAGEIALVANDPYVMEGAELALVIKVKDQGNFEAELERSRQMMKVKYGGEPEVTRKFRGAEYSCIAGVDGSIRSYLYTDSGYAVLANSEQLIKRIISARGEFIESAADNEDFRYLLQVHDGPGDAFCYIGDRFVKRIVSPQFKIAEYRRVNCLANLQVIGYAGTLYRLEHGGSPTVAALEAKGYLAQIPRCPCGGTYGFTKALVPRCHKHGALTHPEPLSANEVDKATDREAELYRGFTDRYHRYWQRFIDPIGIRMDIADTVKVRTVILPRVRSWEYDLLQAFAGGIPLRLEATGLAPGSAVFHLGIKLAMFDGYKEDLSHVAEQQLRKFMTAERDRFKGQNKEEGYDPFRAFGNELDIITLDGPWSSKNMDDWDDLFEWFIRSSVVRIKLDNMNIARKFIPRFIGNDFTINKSGSDSIVMEEKAYGGILFRVSKVYRDYDILALMKGKNLWITTMKGNLDTLFDADISLKKTLPAGHDSTANAEAGFHPGNMKSLKKALRLITHIPYHEQCTKTRERVYRYMLLHSSLAWTDAAAQEAFVNHYIPGGSVSCPLGKSAIMVQGDPLPHCPFHDKDESDLLAAMEQEDSPFSDILFRMGSITADLKFTPEGLDTVLTMGNPLKH